MPDADPSRTILEFVLRLVSTEPQLLMVVEKRGGIKHMSGDLAKVSPCVAERGEWPGSGV